MNKQWVMNNLIRLPYIVVFDVTKIDAEFWEFGHINTNPRCKNAVAVFRLSYPKSKFHDGTTDAFLITSSKRI